MSSTMRPSTVVPLKLLQYASFMVASDIFKPDQITEILGVEPTRVSWRGSRQSTGAVISRSNVWTARPTALGRQMILVVSFVPTRPTNVGRPDRG